MNRKNSFKTFTISEMLMTTKKIGKKMCIILCLSIMLNQYKEQGRKQKRALHYKKQGLNISEGTFLPSLLKSDEFQ